jgi:hypothetical protein
MINPRCFAAAAALLAVLAGCGQPTQQGRDGDKPAARPGAGGAQQPQGNPGAVQPAPVQGDPGAHNTQPGELDLHVEWISENSGTPACEWTKNGAVSPCANIKRAVKDPDMRYYVGLWSREEVAQAGDVFTINAQGQAGVTSIRCVINWKGQYHDGVSNGKRCSITFTVT